MQIKCIALDLDRTTISGNISGTGHIKTEVWENADKVYRS